MQAVENEEALLENVNAEEKAYNWVEAAKLYEEVAESFLGKKQKKRLQKHTECLDMRILEQQEP